MKIQEFEKQLKKINGSLKIVPHPTNLDMVGIYLDTVFICGAPSNEIFEEVKPEYTNKFGDRHRTIEETEAKVNQFLNRWENEEGFKDLFYEK